MREVRANEPIQQKKSADYCWGGTPKIRNRRLEVNMLASLGQARVFPSARDGGPFCAIAKRDSGH